MCNSPCSCACKRQTFYVIGLVIITVGLFGLIWGFFSPSWVQRTGGQTLTVDSVEKYGLWRACGPKSFNRSCGQIIDKLPQIEGAARGSQALMTISLVFIIIGFIAEVLSSLPLAVLKGKCNVLFDNRVVEYVIALAAVVGFVGMLVFAAEVKNKAQREVGQQDGTGKGFSFAVTGQLMVVFGCCLLACGRQVSTETTTA